MVESSGVWELPPTKVDHWVFLRLWGALLFNVPFQGEKMIPWRPIPRTSARAVPWAVIMKPFGFPKLRGANDGLLGTVESLGVTVDRRVIRCFGFTFGALSEFQSA